MGGPPPAIPIHNPRRACPSCFSVAYHIYNTDQRAKVRRRPRPPAAFPVAITEAARSTDFVKRRRGALVDRLLLRSTHAAARTQTQCTGGRPAGSMHAAGTILARSSLRLRAGHFGLVYRKFQQENT